ncbi:prion-like-(Q/N-rich) domain-bearing protein 25 [Formica exsecta]|uniref:prion-like-(Q/N-rich) domain-bearing protein 25 n=1 Tax=Formica exsecta TaxID=72781 RepID=UPI00114358BF|nr:prion-like-(Q/N-rich) domain-bearing protein 25 [Formica exsecta]XP_029667106.1 prion-like-(Q/N-rich) domain-bearing protein 25 [Formica exsecta]
MVSISTGGGKNLFSMRTYTALTMSAIMLTISLTSAEKIDTPIPCGNTSDCRSMLTLPRDAFCKDGYCMCPNVDNGVKFCSSIQAFMHENKIPGPLFYRTCKHNQDCKYEGGFCNSTISQCDCVKDYVPAKNKQHCVQKVRSIDASCTDENQCLAFLANTTCEANKCVCVSGYYYIDNACWRMAGYRRPCTKNQECSHIEGVICTKDMKCECASESVLNMDGKRCLMAAIKIQDECTESVQCSATFENSLCLDKKCQCESDYHYEHDLARCFPNRALDDGCANNYECYQAEDYEENDSPIKSVMCEANKCTCVKNLVRQEDKCVSAGSSFGTSIIVSVITLLCSTLVL